MFKKMQLRRKITLGYSSALVIVFIALVFGIVGLIINVNEFKDYSALEGHRTMAFELNKNFMNAQLAYRQYMSSGDEAFITTFNTEMEQMKDEMRELRKDAVLHQNQRAFRDLTSIVHESIYLYCNSFRDIYNTDAVSSNDKTDPSIIEIEKTMDEIAYEISRGVDEIIESIENEQVSQEVEVVDSNINRMIAMVVITVIAIVFAIIVSLRLFNIILVPIKSLTSAFVDIAEGEADPNFRLEYVAEDELGTLVDSFNRFMEKLQEMLEGSRLENVIKTSQNELHDLSRDEDEMTRICERLLAFIVEEVSGLVGRMYMMDSESEEGVFVSVAQYGLPITEELRIKPMEGIIGNVIRTMNVTFLPRIPKDYMTITTGIGSTEPTEIAVFPCIYEDRVIAILEIGHLGEFDGKTIIHLQALTNSVGNIIHSIGLRTDAKRLYEQTVRQAEEMKEQQEELLQSNQELEEQTIALRESEQILQAQQEELRVSNEELEERSRQLEKQKIILDDKNKAIMESQDEILEKAYELEQANRYKSEFLANMSHELRTPLNSILVLSQLLNERDNDKPLSNKELEFAGTINASGKDLLTLINGVLDLSKVEAGRLELVKEEIDIKGFMEEFKRLFTPVAEMKDIEFKTMIGEGIPDCLVSDRFRLSQIIKNLISNAIKFTNDGHVTLSLRKPTSTEISYGGYKESDQRDYIAFVVQDTGIGIDEHKREIIFEAFKQEDGTTSRTYGGTGLGLTISLELSRLLGGNIVLESEVGVGSQFVLLVPIMGLEDDKDSSLEEKIEEVRKRKDYLHSDLDMDEVLEADKMDISTDSDIEKDFDGLLIIEDDQNFAQTLSTLVEEKGFATILAHSATEGLRMAKEMNPMAIILDIGLPDMDGMEVAKALEENPLTKDIPIHIVSGKDVINEALMPKSIIGFLKKPVDIKTIYKTLAKIEKVAKEDQNNLLVVGECGGESFEDFTNLGNVNVIKVSSGKEAIDILKKESYGCIVLDTKLADMTGMSFISATYDELGYKIPVVIYTEEEINLKEYEHMSQVAESVIIKTEKSKERLVDEVSLFLHDMSKSIEDYKVSNDKKALIDMKAKTSVENDFVGKKVLIVDDDERNIFALMHALELQGLEVVVAKDGFDAIDKFKEMPDIHMILMDIMMPKMDGYEAIKTIRGLDIGRDVPIIALTAKAMSEDRDKCLKVGADDYLTKPIDMDKLISLMKVWIS